MFAAFVGVRAPANDLANGSHHHRADTGIRRSQRHALTSELQRLLHELLVAGGLRNRHLK